MQQETKPVDYSEYLQLDKILNAQNPESQKYGAPAHDETLFIITHQAYELWFKQIIHELDSLLEIFGQDYVPERNLAQAVSYLKRITEIQKVLIDHLNILETMTPLDFLDFRDYLLPASGFQSFQFRAVEMKLGLPLSNRFQYQESFFMSRFSNKDQKYLTEVGKKDSLLTLIEKWLERIPFLIFKDFNFWQLYEEAVDKMMKKDQEIIQRNTSLNEKEKEFQLQEHKSTYENFQGLLRPESHQQLVKEGKRRLSQKSTLSALFISLYRDEPIFHNPFQILTSLVDIDELFTTWRYRHSMMAHRMVGTKIGTGGSSGATYLKNSAERSRIFLDFTNLSTFLIPRKTLPTLPPELKDHLGFFFSQGPLEKRK